MWVALRVTRNATCMVSQNIFQMEAKNSTQQSHVSHDNVLSKRKQN